MDMTFKDLAATLAGEINSGRPTRQTFGSKDTAFGWLPGLPISLASYVATAQCEGLSFDAVRVEPSATPVTVVAEKGTKPDAVKFTPVTVPLKKYAGRAQWTLERQISTDALLAVIANCLGAQALQALEADAVTAITTAAGSNTHEAATIGAAVIAAQASILGAGGRPGLVVLGTSAYADLLTAGATGFVSDPAAGPIGTWLGSTVHVSPTVPADTAFVLDPAAVIIAESTSSPVAIVNPYTHASTNELELVVDVIAAPVVIAPGLVAKAAKKAA